VLARVKPHNSYGGLTAGVVVDVPEEEIDRVSWCLERLDEPAEEHPEASPQAVSATGDAEGPAPRENPADLVPVPPAERRSKKK
jgi:hypothetical protein